jgi:hypothetical protein
MTLTMGLWPRQGHGRVRAMSVTWESHTHSQECERVWKNEPTHPNGFPLWKLVRYFKKNKFEGPNFIELKISLYHWNFFKMEMSKMGSHYPFECLWHKLWLKGRKSKCQFDFWPLKVGNCLELHVCKRHVTYRWKISMKDTILH